MLPWLGQCPDICSGAIPRKVFLDEISHSVGGLNAGGPHPVRCRERTKTDLPRARRNPASSRPSGPGPQLFLGSPACRPALQSLDSLSEPIPLEESLCMTCWLCFSGQTLTNTAPHRPLGTGRGESPRGLGGCYGGVGTGSQRGRHPQGIRRRSSARV